MKEKRARRDGKNGSLRLEDSSRAETENKGESWGAAGAVLIVCLMTLPLLVFLSNGRFGSTLIWLRKVKVTISKGAEGNSTKTSIPVKDRLLSGLLSPNFDNKSCLSRYESALYHKKSPYAPSSYLLHKLRQYESLHKKCGPNTRLYRKSITQLNSGHSLELMDCNYIVWTPYNGLGNRMLSLVSSFLYALLTNRVLLIQPTDDSVDLFCEPFPDTSWILPSDFPIKNLTQLNVWSETTYGNMLDKHNISNNPKTPAESLPPYVYLHLEHDYHNLDKLFFCNDDQVVLGKVNWLILQSDLYFVPSLFSIPVFEEELRWLFPVRESIFHLLARYLIHPTNSVWGLVTRYHLSYLARYEERIGIQIRLFPWSSLSKEDVFEQIMNCSRLESVLPEIDLNETDRPSPSRVTRSKAILVTSLDADYYEKFKSMYYEHSSKTGEFVSVFQPSHEGKQSTEKQSHNQKALAEIYLLSFCDVLVTSGVSTFGYVSHGLAGIKPVFLVAVRKGKVPDPPCVRADSMEPCLHTPPNVNCRGKRIDKEVLQQRVKRCEDIYEGIKLFD